MKGWNQEELAKLCGFSRSSIINWENGKRIPRTNDIKKLAMVLAISPQELLDDIDDTLQENTQQQKSQQEHQMDIQSISQTIGAGSTSFYSYWGGVLDNALRLAESKNMREINLIAPLLQQAYEAIANVWGDKTNTSAQRHSDVSAYNGDHSNYIGNELKVEKTTA